MEAPYIRSCEANVAKEKDIAYQRLLAGVHECDGQLGNDRTHVRANHRGKPKLGLDLLASDALITASRKVAARGAFFGAHTGAVDRTRTVSAHQPYRARICRAATV